MRLSSSSSSSYFEHVKAADTRISLVIFPFVVRAFKSDTSSPVYYPSVTSLRVRHSLEKADVETR